VTRRGQTIPGTDTTNSHLNFQPRKGLSSLLLSAAVIVIVIVIVIVRESRENDDELRSTK